MQFSIFAARNQGVLSVPCGGKSRGQQRGSSCTSNYSIWLVAFLPVHFNYWRELPPRIWDGMFCKGSANRSQKLRRYNQRKGSCFKNTVNSVKSIFILVFSKNFSCRRNLPANLPLNPFPSYPLISAFWSRYGSARFRRKWAKLFGLISAGKALKSYDFRTLMVAGEGFEPTTSGL